MTDPVTGLTGGLIPEPDYPERCRHCARRIRRLGNGAWADSDGWMRCMKDVDHLPMSAGNPGGGSAAEVGNAIRAARKHVGLTQGELADALGVTQTAVPHWETGCRSLDVETLLRCARALDVQPSDLLGGGYVHVGDYPPALLRAVADILGGHPDVDVNAIGDRIRRAVTR